MNGGAKGKRGSASSGSAGWWRSAWTLAACFRRRLDEHNVSVLAAAVAFYSFLSIFPAIAALVSLYGLIADPHDIARQLNALRTVLPEEAVAPLSAWLNVLAKQTHPHFGLGLVVSVAISVWSARYATATLMTALDVAYAASEERSFLLYNAVALLLTALLIVFVACAVILIAILPVLIGYLPIPARWQAAAMWIRWPFLLGMILVAVALLYRYAPNRTDSRWDLASAGAVVATAGLITGSYGLSLYVNTFAVYQKTYGSLGAVAVLMTWLWIAAYSLLAGAELNAEIARGRK